MFDPNSKVEGMKVVLHYLEGLIPSTLIRISLTLQLGKWIAKDENGRPCFWAGKGHKHFLIQKQQDEQKAKRLAEEEKQALVEDPIYGGDFGVGSKKKKKKKEKEKKLTAEEIAKKQREEEDRNAYGDDVMILDETQIWYQDFYSLFWNKSYKGDNRNLYLLIQVLQLKKNKQPSGANITKQLLLDEYDLIGYGTEQLSSGDGKVKYGEFEVPLYRPPIYVCEFEQARTTPLKIKINVEKPNLNIPITRPEPKTELDKKLKGVLNLLERENKKSKSRR